MMVTMNENPAARLDRIMDVRRLELDLDWKEVADLAGISVQTLDVVRKGKNSTVRTKRKIDRALQWVPGEGVEAIAAGREPTPTDRLPEPSRPSERPTLEELAARVAATEQEISALRAERVSANEEIDALRAELRRTRSDSTVHGRHSETG